MKKILVNSLLVGLGAGLVNSALAYFLGDGPLETPYAPQTTDPQPAGQFAVAAGIFTVILTLIGGLILGLLTRKNPDKGLRTWRIIGVVFLILYGAFPFFAPVASDKAGILTNLLHLVAGFAALYFIPKQSGLEE